MTGKTNKQCWLRCTYKRAQLLGVHWGKVPVIYSWDLSCIRGYFVQLEGLTEPKP